jgi:hypothetical protein
MTIRRAGILAWPCECHSRGSSPPLRLQAAYRRGSRSVGVLALAGMGRETVQVGFVLHPQELAVE